VLSHSLAREQASSTDTLTVGWLAVNGYPFWSRFAMEQNATNVRNCKRSS
jgi:hypothetical protein